MASRMKQGLAAGAARQLAPRMTQLAPGLTQSFVREALHRAIHGIGPLPPAAAAAEEQLREQHGNVDKAIREVIENHVLYASIEGFATNLGGLVTATLVAPANITGLALIQCRMVAGIAHLRGHDLDDPRVRNAILVTILGEDHVTRMVKRKELPGTPMSIATAAELDPTLDQRLASAVAAELIGRVIGKRVAVTVSKRVPVVGGAVGAATDGWTTFRVGRYAGRELRPLALR